MAKKTEGKMGLAAMILGIIGLVVANIPLGVLAIVFGVIGMQKNQRYAKAGFILGIVDIAIAVIVMLVLGSLLFAGLAAFGNI